MPIRSAAAATLLAVAFTSCESEARLGSLEAQSCTTCHNGSQHDDYAGPGIRDPHPFPGAEGLLCTTCHGGDPTGADALASHVPPPPEIGDREHREQDREAWFNRLTLAGLDKYPGYTANGRTWSALDYLQFVNPGDLRVVTAGRSCGQCHAGHAECVGESLLATEAGILSGATYATGVDNAIAEYRALFEDTAADLAFRAVEDPGYTIDPLGVGRIARLLEYPVFSRRVQGPDSSFRNDDYDAAALPADVEPDGSARTDSRLAHLLHEQFAFTCGDCHLGSAGANNRYGDFRSSGCTACHMPYSRDGRSRSRDPNVDKLEPRDPDDIAPPERAHVRSHRIVSVAKTLQNGVELGAIDDHACAGCHQGSNRTVMQYWGIRLDQNQNVRRGVQYPANPVSYRNTRDDPRLFDPDVGNRTFNGRYANQYLAFEDYDGDGRDDTPADVHHEAGLGCIDCHGSHDLHGGDVTDPPEGIASRMGQNVAIECESCHGGIATYAATAPGTTYDGRQTDLAVDERGNPLRHVERDAEGHFWLTSKLTGARHYVVQTLDVVADNGRTHPISGNPLFSPKASFAMGRNDGNTATGIGPVQSDATATGFAHSDSMSCAACHSSWTNTCMGCHLEGEYDEGQNFSNITGERIAFREKFAEFVYQSPVPMWLGVDGENRIAQVCPNTKMFFRYEDRQGDRSRVFAFSDRNGGGNDPAKPRPSLGHNAMLAHSIRGRIDAENEGPRYCAACHLTETGLSTFGEASYDAFRSHLAAGAYDQLDYGMLQEHIGRNPGNRLESPIWVHMAAGLGSGLFLFDENGCPVNPLDEDDARFGCDGVAPADVVFDPSRVRFDLDRIVDSNGVPTGSSNHPMRIPGALPLRRDGAPNPNLAGPLGATLIRRLTDPTTGIVLDAWLDADGVVRGAAPPGL